MTKLLVVAILLLVIGVIVAFIERREKEDYGCSFQCDECPFPPCNEKEKQKIEEQMAKLEGDLHGSMGNR